MPAGVGRVKSGRRYDMGVNLDHLVLYDNEADALVAWFRGIRGNKFSLPFSPLDDGTASYWIAKNLSFQRAGTWWDGTLEIVKA